MFLSELMDDSIEDTKDSTNERALELCIAALKYLHQCSSMLGSMYNMPACPVFHTAQRYVMLYIAIFVRFI